MTKIVSKRSGFKNYNETFWINETGKYGCRYQCKHCGCTTLGIGGGNRMHYSTCPKRVDETPVIGEPKPEPLTDAEAAAFRMLIDIDKLERLAKAATPGPWSATDGCCVFADGSSGIADTFALNKDHPNGVTILCPWSQPQCQANARHIAAASPDVVLSLVDELRQLRQLAGAVESWVDECTIDASDDRALRLAFAEYRKQVTS